MISSTEKGDESFHGRHVILAKTASTAIACLLAIAAAAAPTAGRAEAPLDAVFVLDNSGSMRAHDPDFITRRVVQEFTRALAPDARVGMVAFDADARLLEPLAHQDEPAARADFAASLAGVDYSGQRTNSPAGIERALYELKTGGRPEARKVIIFLTDGIIDTGDVVADRRAGRWLRETLSAAAKKAGVRIFGIAFTASADVELIQTLALQTDGEYFRAIEADEIPGVLDEILAHVSRPGAPPRAAEAPAPVATPPVSAASGSEDEPRIAPALVAGALLALVGVVGGLVASRRHRPAQRSDDATAPRPVAPVAPAVAPAAPGAEKPQAKLLDVMRASPRGVLPLSMERDKLRVGRDAKNDIVIAKDTISSFHATIEYKDGYFLLEDHRSSNGTNLNQRPLAPNQPVELKSGDRIDFAEFEFRFLLPDQQPAGKTVILGGSRVPREFTQGSPEEEMAPPIEGDGTLFRQCLTGHLRRIGALGESYQAFLDQHLGSRRVDRLESSVVRLMGHAVTDRKGRHEVFAKREVLFVLCVIPETMERASAWFGEHFGGYTQLLSHFLDSKHFADHGCKVLCVITYGRSRDAWVSVTIAPGDDAPGPIDIMSVELLSEDERRALALHFDEIGQVV